MRAFRLASWQLLAMIIGQTVLKSTFRIGFDYFKIDSKSR